MCKCTQTHTEFCLSKDYGITLGVNFLPHGMQQECSHNGREPLSGHTPCRRHLQRFYADMPRLEMLSASPKAKGHCSLSRSQSDSTKLTCIISKEVWVCFSACVSDFSLLGLKLKLVLTWALSYPHGKDAYWEKRWSYFETSSRRLFSINLMRFRKT